MPGSPSPEIARARASLAGLTRCRPSDDPRVIRAKQNLKEATAADYIRSVVETAPALSAAQRERLALLLRGDA